MISYHVETDLIQIYTKPVFQARSWDVIFLINFKFGQKIFVYPKMLVIICQKLDLYLLLGAYYKIKINEN